MSTFTTSWSTIMTRLLAAGITFGVGTASFALSFSALRDLAARAHVPPAQAGLFPLMVDGAILLATLGVVVMAGDPQCRKDRRFFWLVLCGGAAVSIACNTLHAVLPPDQPINAWLRGFIAAVAPIWLLLTTHGLTLLLSRMRRHAAAQAPSAEPTNNNAGIPGREAHAHMDAGAAALPTPSEHSLPAHLDSVQAARAESAPPIADLPADSRYHDMARCLLDKVSLKNTGRAEVAQVLFLNYERVLPDRDIARRLGLDHHTVAKIVQAADAHARDEHEEGVLAAS